MIKYPILSYKYHVFYPIEEIIIYKSRASQKVEANKNLTTRALFVIVHFKVACLVAKPLNRSEAKVDLVMVQT